MAAERAREVAATENHPPEEEVARATAEVGKEKQPPREEAAAAVTLTNLTRRPIHVRIGVGQTIRLGPGQTSAALGEHCSRASEVRALRGKGVLAVAAAALDPAKKAPSKTRGQEPKKSSRRGRGSGRKPPEHGSPEAPENP